jgi:hypothetical protein
MASAVGMMPMATSPYLPMEGSSTALGMGALPMVSNPTNTYGTMITSLPSPVETFTSFPQVLRSTDPETSPRPTPSYHDSAARCATALAEDELIESEVRYELATMSKEGTEPAATDSRMDVSTEDANDFVASPASPAATPSADAEDELPDEVSGERYFCALPKTVAEEAQSSYLGRPSGPLGEVEQRAISASYDRINRLTVDVQNLDRMLYELALEDALFVCVPGIREAFFNRDYVVGRATLYKMIVDTRDAKMAWLTTEKRKCRYLEEKYCRPREY